MVLIMAKKDKAHVSETPATQMLKAHKVAFTEHPYEYVEHGGTSESARQLGLDEHSVIKTLVMQDQDAKPLIVLMHGDCTVSTKNLARQIGAKSVEPCKPEVANRHSGYLVGGTSPFGTRKDMPVYISKGRAGWNIVTSWAPRAGENYGLAADLEHSDRYRIAQEFVEAVDALWRSFPASAIVDDATSGQFVDIGQIRPINYAGQHIRTRGPLNVPSSPQGRPVLVQAGQSEDGRAFAAQWAEAIFTAHGSKESAQSFYRDIKARAHQNGRRPEDIVILPGISAAIGSTEHEAKQVWEELDSLTSVEVGLTRLSARFGGHDFSSLPLDRKLTRDDFPDPNLVEASKSRAIGYVETTLRDGLTLRQLLKRLAGARGHLAIAGTPEQVADTIEDWFKTGAADGFNVMPPVITQQLELFANEVVPILRKRGLFRSEYESSSLRGHFGLQDLPIVKAAQHTGANVNTAA